MAKYLIEAPHESSPQACLRALDAFLQAGAHFLTNAEWGCMDGDHRAWIIIDADSEAEARMVIPPVLRHSAHVVKLTKFTPEKIRELKGNV